nr:K727 [uncultured bacterium]
MPQRESAKVRERIHAGAICVMRGKRSDVVPEKSGPWREFSGVSCVQLVAIVTFAGDVRVHPPRSEAQGPPGHR